MSILTDYVQLSTDIKHRVERLQVVRDMLSESIKELEGIDFQIPLLTDDDYDIQANSSNLEVLKLAFSYNLTIIGNRLRTLEKIGISFKKPEWLD